MSLAAAAPFQAYQESKDVKTEGECSESLQNNTF
jgi:hypothetical protein